MDYSIVVYCQGLRQDVELMPPIVLDHVTQDGLVIDHRLNITPLQGFTGLYHKRVAA